MAKVKVTIDIREIKKLIPKVRREFSIIAPDKIKREIKEDISRGVSPVGGKGRFAKYSTSYKAQIRGEAAFRKGKGGKVFPITTKGIKGSGASKKRAAIKDKLFDLNEVFRKNNKRVSPVNMKLTGDMIRSLQVTPSLVLTNKMRLLIAFGDDKAVFHNDKGAGGKTVRRLLPTNSGERFNTRLTTLMRNLLNKAVSNVVKRTK